MNSTGTPGKTYLVESIPTGMDDLKVTPGVGYSDQTLLQLTQSAQQSIDLTVMYWALRPNPTRSDETGFSKDELVEKFGAGQGLALFDALQQAAGRGVRIRIVESPGFDPHDDESQTLQTAYPNQVERRQIKLEDWYGSGIMHQKLWLFDRKSIYLGSANMDWKSLTQVKEIGVVVEDNCEVAAELGRYFDTWWAFSDRHTGYLRPIRHGRPHCPRLVAAGSSGAAQRQPLGPPRIALPVLLGKPAIG